jgi:hypothetical protein
MLAFCYSFVLRKFGPHFFAILTNGVCRLAKLRNKVFANSKIENKQGNLVSISPTCSFCVRRSQKHKKADDLTVFFTLLCSACVNTAPRMLMKLTPGVNFTYIQQAPLLPVDLQ